MLGALNAGVSGIQQFQTKLDVIGNNIANSNTVGFKGARAEFEDTFNQTLYSSNGRAGTPGVQVGSGVGTSSVRSLFTQGTLSGTGRPTDLGVAGEGFFVVRDPSDTTSSFATRAGDFNLSPEGYLVTNGGLRLQGYNTPDLSAQGDIMVNDDVRPAGMDPAAKYDSFSITSEGKIMIRLSNGKEYARGQVLLQNFRDPAALTKEGHNLFSGFEAAGPLGGTTPASAAPGTNGLGKIQSGSLEGSNVDLTSEFASLITTQRGFQANARIITTSDELLQEIVNLKR